MKQANSSHRTLVVDILRTSFDENQSINYIVRSGINRRERITHLMEYCFDVCMKKGMIFLSDNEEGCVLILLPEKRMNVFRVLALEIKLLFHSVGFTNAWRVMKREKQLKTHHPKEPFYYLWFAGVYPNSQGTGIGTQLLKEVLAYCDKKKRPVYLETSVMLNLPWYERFGFTIYHEIDLGYKLYQMMRD
jgi:hypothetical protein